MKRSLYSDQMECAECGALVKVFEEFDYCGKCGKPIHVGCAEFVGNEHFCPGCKPKENDHE